MDPEAEVARAGAAPLASPPAPGPATPSVGPPVATGGVVVVDLGKVLTAPPDAPETKTGPPHGGAARGQGEKDSVVLDIKGDAGKVPGGGERGSEKLCRICHLSQERLEGSESSELINLGCGCKDDLALSHRHCSEAWFKLKGNRYGFWKSSPSLYHIPD